MTKNASQSFDDIFSNVQSDLLTEDTRSKIRTLIQETVDAKVKSAEALLKEEFEKKTTEVVSEYEQKKTLLEQEMKHNEAVLVEEAEKYKSEIESIVLSETQAYKEKTQKEIAEETAAYRAELEKAIIEEAKTYKAKQDAELVEQVKSFKEDLINKVSDYLETQVEESIPQEIMEAATKLEVYEPLVKKIMESFSSNFIKLDTTSYKLIKEARDEISTKEEEIQTLNKDIVRLKKEMKEAERNIKVNNLMEGLTSEQRQRALKLLEGVSVSEIDARWKSIKEMIFEKKEVAETPKQVVVESKTVVQKPVVQQKQTIAENAVVEHQVQKVITEGKSPSLSQKKPEDKKIGQWAAKVQKANTRN